MAADVRSVAWPVAVSLMYADATLVDRTSCPYGYAAPSPDWHRLCWWRLAYHVATLEQRIQAVGVAYSEIWMSV